MTIDALRPRDLAYTNDPQEVEAKPHNNDQTTKTPDFASSVFAAVHLPTGLIGGHAGSSVTRDLADLQAKVSKVAADLNSPEIAAALKADAKVYGAYVFFNACFLPLAKAAFIDQGPAKIMGGAIAALALYKGLPAAIDELKSAHQAATSANASAHPAFAQLVKDLVAMQESALKLAVDVKKSGGV